jgi:hypothetical protein
MTTPAKRVEASPAPLNYTTPPVARPGKVAVIIGWILSLIPILMMGVMSIVMQLFNRDMMVQEMAKHGFAANTVTPISVAAIVSALLYAIPRTAVLGAILLTGYLGGAVCVHVRGGDGQWPMPVIIGIIVWLGLFLRDPRVRALAPLREPLRK